MIAQINGTISAKQPVDGPRIVGPNNWSLINDELQSNELPSSVRARFNADFPPKNKNDIEPIFFF